MKRERDEYAAGTSEIFNGGSVGKSGFLDKRTEERDIEEECHLYVALLFYFEGNNVLWNKNTLRYTLISMTNYKSFL